MKRIKRTRLFVGFSTAGSDKSRNWQLYDVELIKQDLLNHFNTRVGERVMRPDYGCAIHDYLMEKMSDANRDAIAAEAIRVCESDSRVAVEDVQVQALDQAIRVQITLLYRPFDVVETFAVDFETRQQELFNEVSD